MYIIYMAFKEPDEYGQYSCIRENENFSKALQAAEEMRTEYSNVIIKSIDIINSIEPLKGLGCFKGTIIASLRVIK